MRTVIDFFAQLTKKVYHSKRTSADGEVKLHHCPVCNQDHY